MIDNKSQLEVTGREKIKTKLPIEVMGRDLIDSKSRNEVTGRQRSSKGMKTAGSTHACLRGDDQKWLCSCRQ